jgi:hypothetical protein
MTLTANRPPPQQAMMLSPMQTENPGLVGMPAENPGDQGIYHEPAYPRLVLQRRQYGGHNSCGRLCDYDDPETLITMMPQQVGHYSQSRSLYYASSPLSLQAKVSSTKVALHAACVREMGFEP